MAGFAGAGLASGARSTTGAPYRVAQPDASAIAAHAAATLKDVRITSV